LASKLFFLSQAFHGGGYDSHICSPEEMASTKIKEEKFFGWKNSPPMPNAVKKPSKMR
jgi:hypothetical protein